MKLSLLASSTEIPKQFDYNARLVKLEIAQYILGHRQVGKAQDFDSCIFDGSSPSAPAKNDGVVKWLRPQSAKLSDPQGREFKSHRHLQTFNVLVNATVPRATK